ncbi:unnamed protein product [Protopolystoma xenopodis]|uniref:Phosphorylase b kinase regulatory subunit n=1 Tax=Protopolystoma xenopodis TaxID=117903 RepID=A0A448WK43_9PLAT|nr:unnamed protein product [Protopolystoma xenopodis]
MAQNPTKMESICTSLQSSQSHSPISSYAASAVNSGSVTRSHSIVQQPPPGYTIGIASTGTCGGPENDLRNLWSRRRKIDGALNRVPPGFFQSVYAILERVQGLRIGEHVLSQNLTKEVSTVCL